MEENKRLFLHDKKIKFQCETNQKHRKLLGFKKSMDLSKLKPYSEDEANTFRKTESARIKRQTPNDSECNSTRKVESTRSHTTEIKPKKRNDLSPIKHFIRSRIIIRKPFLKSSAYSSSMTRNA